jgi:hypothetical protein
MRLALGIALFGIALLQGCAQQLGGAHPAANADHPRAEALLNRAPPPVREVREVKEVTVDASATLREGIRLYTNGDFTAAIAKLDAPEIQNANIATRTSALKYTAFSYCVTQRPVPCRQAFDKALRLDAGFALAPGEEGHPMWGPVYDKARAAR